MMRWSRSLPFVICLNRDVYIIEIMMLIRSLVCESIDLNNLIDDKISRTSQEENSLND